MPDKATRKQLSRIAPKPCQPKPKRQTLATISSATSSSTAGYCSEIGAWVGLKGILPTILLSSLVGAIVGSIWLAAKGRDRATPIPFGPYLAAAGWIVFFWGDQLIGAYLHLAGLR
jgi:hypothetical protein